MALLMDDKYNQPLTATRPLRAPINTPVGSGYCHVEATTFRRPQFHESLKMAEAEVIRALRDLPETRSGAARRCPSP